MMDDEGNITDVCPQFKVGRGEREEEERRKGREGGRERKGEVGGGGGGGEDEGCLRRHFEISYWCGMLTVV